LGIIARYTTPQNIEFIGGFYNGNGYKDLYLQADHPLMVASAVFQTGFWSFQPLFTLRESAQIGAIHDWEWNSGFSANLNAPKTRAGFELVYQSHLTQNKAPKLPKDF
jgi:hypothetical protein